MTSVIFVHGTSTREDDYDDSFDKIEEELKKRVDGVNVIRCYWGELRDKLQTDKPSVKSDSSTGSSIPRGEETNRWFWLYQNPLHELQLLCELLPSRTNNQGPRHFVGENPQSVLRRFVEDFDISYKLQEKLDHAGITEEEFDKAWVKVTESDTNNKLLNVVGKAQPGEYEGALARATMAQISVQSEQPGAISMNTTLRDEIVEMLTDELGGHDRGEMGPIVKATTLNIFTLFTPKSLVEFFETFSEDILRYQGCGEYIRDFIKPIIKNATPPVVLLGHSLGGIICFDLLVEEEQPKVDFLITVGSQVPFLYKIGALQSLCPDKSLPPHFPRWLNIYDPDDFLSYSSEGLFSDRVEDVDVYNSIRSAPSIHNGYWDNKKIWQEIVKRLPNLPSKQKM